VFSGRGPASGLSLVQRIPTECGVSIECDCEAPSGEAMTRNRVEEPKEKKLTKLLCNIGEKVLFPSFILLPSVSRKPGTMAKIW